MARGGKEPLVVQTSFETAWKLRPADLREALKDKARKDSKWLMVINNPGNPCERIEDVS